MSQYGGIEHEISIYMPTEGDFVRRIRVPPSTIGALSIRTPEPWVDEVEPLNERFATGTRSPEAEAG